MPGMRPVACLNCGNRDVHAVADIDGTERAPRPGDPVVCMTCREVMTVDADGELAAWTEPQIAALCARFGIDPSRTQFRRPFRPAWERPHFRRPAG